LLSQQRNKLNRTQDAKGRHLRQLQLHLETNRNSLQAYKPTVGTDFIPNLDSVPTTRLAHTHRRVGRRSLALPNTSTRKRGGAQLAPALAYFISLFRLCSRSRNPPGWTPIPETEAVAKYKQRQQQSRNRENNKNQVWHTQEGPVRRCPCYVCNTNLLVAQYHNLTQ
jgi:hypothetical protein